MEETDSEYGDSGLFDKGFEPPTSEQSSHSFVEGLGQRQARRSSHLVCGHDICRCGDLVLVRLHTKLVRYYMPSQTRGL